MSLPFCVLCLVCIPACDLGPSNVEQGWQKKVLHLGNGTEPVDLDPHIVTGVTEHNIISALLEGLVSEHPRTLAPMPGAARWWKISADGLRYTFKLQENGRWSNGDALTAEDFVWSWQRVLSAELGSEYAYQLYPIRNARAYHQGQLKDFSKVGVRAVDNLTLEVELAHPTAYFLSLLAHFSTFPVHPNTVLLHGGMTQRGSHWTRPGNFVGNGPFQLQEWRLNYRITVTKNLHYWDAAKVDLNAIRFYPIDNVQTEERMFRTGVLHVASSLPPDKIQTYLQQASERISIDPYLGTYYYRFNTQRPPLNDARVRRALSLAINRQLLVDAITKGGQQAAYSFTPPDIHGYSPPQGLVRFDVDAARQLLAEAGFPGGQGFPALELLYNTSDGHRRVAVAIQQMWKQALGIDIALSNQDWKVYLSRVQELDYDIARAGWIGDYPDPNTFLDMFVSEGGNNRTGWRSARYDKLIAAAASEPSNQKRMQYFYQAESELLEQSPIMPLYIYTRVQLKHPGVQGWWPNVLDHHPYKYVRLQAPDLAGTQHVACEKLAALAGDDTPSASSAGIATAC
ncbi:MAG: peptide ABC transporter substrate-binding protein [Gammaproteobacteria bacterium]|nr:peptide ABC transporter substrate-binding protein [Gammaproteobacteria bacterium]